MKGVVVATLKNGLGGSRGGGGGGRGRGRGRAGRTARRDEAVRAQAPRRAGARGLRRARAGARRPRAARARLPPDVEGRGAFPEALRPARALRLEAGGRG